MAQRILGLDIGQSSIKGVLIDNKLKSFEVLDFHKEPILAPDSDDPEVHKAALHHSIHNIMEKLGPADQVISCMPGGMGAFANLDFPFSDNNKINQSIGFQLDDMSPFDVEDLHFDYQFIEREKASSRLLVGSVPKEEFSEYVEDLCVSGVDPRILMMDGLPYYHLFKSVKEPPEEGIWGVLDIGHIYSTITVFQKYEEATDAEKMRTESVRSMSRGVQQLAGPLAAALNIPVEQVPQVLREHLDLRQAAEPNASQVTQVVSRALTPLLTEVRRMIASLQRKFSAPFKTLYVTGGGAQLNGIIEFLKHRLHLDVQRLDLDHIETAEEVVWPVEQQDEYLKALALALRGTYNSRFSQINLRKGEFSFKGDLQFLKERLGSIFVGVLILLFLFLTSVATKFYVLSVENQRLQVKAEESCRKILGQSISDPNRCVLIMLDEIQKVSGTGKKAIIPKVSSYDVFLEVYDRVAKLIKRKNVKVEIGTMRIDAGRFDIEGETTSYGAVDQIQKRLSTYRCFKKMKKGRVQRVSGKQGKVEFRLWAQISC